MKMETSTKTQYILTLEEEELIWLHRFMQNFIEPNRPDTQPPIEEPKHDRIMRHKFFEATRTES